MPIAPLTLRGCKIFQGLLAQHEQEMIVAAVRRIVSVAPLLSPCTPSGRPMSVQMSSAGKYGWISDRQGYRYARSHPQGMSWPGIPEPILALWSDLVSPLRRPDCCLINFYGEGARMGLHQDRDEADFSWPVMSISLGDEGLFRVGNSHRGGKTESVWLRSGDVVLMGGKARLVYHGVDRIRFQSSNLLPKGGRINLTLRVVD